MCALTRRQRDKAESEYSPDFYLIKRKAGVFLCARIWRLLHLLQYNRVTQVQNSRRFSLYMSFGEPYFNEMWTGERAEIILYARKITWFCLKYLRRRRRKRVVRN